MSQKPPVGFIGLGDMGAPIARRIAACGFPTVLWARREATLTPFGDLRDAGRIRFASDPLTLARTSDIVGLCVFGDDDVRELALTRGLLSHLRPKSVLVVHSTVSVDVCRELADAGERYDVAVLDAPVSGGRAAATAGTLAIMAGGTAEAYERALPVLSSYGSLIRHMGAVGSGQTMKLLNNVAHIANAQLSWLAIELGHELGLDTAPLIDVLRAGTAGNQGLEVLVTAMAGDPDVARHIHAMQRKDVALFGELRAGRGVPETRLESFVRGRLGRGVSEVVLP